MSRDADVDDESYAVAWDARDGHAGWPLNVAVSRDDKPLTIAMSRDDKRWPLLCHVTPKMNSDQMVR